MGACGCNRHATAPQKAPAGPSRAIARSFARCPATTNAPARANRGRPEARCRHATNTAGCAAVARKRRNARLQLGQAHQIGAHRARHCHRSSRPQARGSQAAAVPAGGRRLRSGPARHPGDHRQGRQPGPSTCRPDVRKLKGRAAWQRANPGRNPGGPSPLAWRGGAFHPHCSRSPRPSPARWLGGCLSGAETPARLKRPSLRCPVLSLPGPSSSRSFLFPVLCPPGFRPAVSGCMADPAAAGELGRALLLGKPETPC